MITITGIPRKISLRKISSLHMKKTVRKGCKLFVVHIMNNEKIGKEDKLRFYDIPILQDFSDVFQDYLQREIWILQSN